MDSWRNEIVGAPLCHSQLDWDPELIARSLEYWRIGKIENPNGGWIAI